MEDADPAIIHSLRAGDVLFIDSSHMGEEVRQHAAFLKALPAGVHVHYHDIDYPWPRPYTEWDEDEIVHDFIRDHQWPVRVCGSLLTRDYLQDMWEHIPHYRKTPYRRYNAVWLVSTGNQSK